MRLLRRDDAAEGVAPRQDDASMVDLRLRWPAGIRQTGPFDQRAAAGRAPVGLGFRRENGVAVGADALHHHQGTGSGWSLYPSPPIGETLLRRRP